MCGSSATSSFWSSQRIASQSFPAKASQSSVQMPQKGPPYHQPGLSSTNPAGSVTHSYWSLEASSRLKMSFVGLGRSTHWSH